MVYVSKMAAVFLNSMSKCLSLKREAQLLICGCKFFRQAGGMSSKATAVRPGLQSPSRSLKQGRQIKAMKQSLDMKSALTRQLKRRRELAQRRNLKSVKPRIADTEESVSRGRREIVIEPSCQNPAFTPKDNQAQVRSFHSFGLRDDIVQGLDGLSITKPTVTQMVTIPPVLNRKHVLCAAQTGTGKTLAYLLPIVHHLKEEHDLGMISRLKRPRVLIAVPNRELALQVLKVAKLLSHNARFRSALLTGGRKLRILKSVLESPVDLLVGTPGTLLEFRERGRLFFSDVSYLVIDEADSMFDDTFKSETMKLLETISIRQGKSLPRTSDLPTDSVDAQVTIVGATMPKELVDSLQDMLLDLHICTSNSHHVLPHIRHKFLKTPQHLKPDKLLEILRQDLQVADRRTVVFCNTTPSCDYVGHFLRNHGVEHIKLHSTVAIQERRQRFKDFQNEKARILLCTDVASRGLDTNVDHVINFDFPMNLTDYLHRVGRTGRVKAGAQNSETSETTSFMTHNRDVRMALIIEEAARTQESAKTVEARMAKQWHKSRPEPEVAQRRGRHLTSRQAPDMRVRST
ncbi:uncharacterized protein LOC141889977 isoform X3 [Acropora palmata]|uniref:uncharacterized protein LOC141889977 isoform X3 n=1 Tax=Acropora palmata TaxID=6131 RepID=UPI003DA03DC6